MKKILPILLIFLLLFDLKISFGQAYHPFPDTLASWNEVAYSTGEFLFYNQGWRFNLSSDTIIDGITYSQVGFDSTFYHSYYPGGSDILLENYNYSVPGEIFGAVREDSNKKVWFRKFHDIDLGLCFSLSTIDYPLDSDILIYDFGVAMGDTIAWKPYNNVVLQIDSTKLLNGEWHRKILFDNGSEFWMDGIGSSLGFFGAYEEPPDEYSCVLSCFRQNEILLFPNWSFNYECDFVYTLTSEISSETTLTVAPNPASDLITFDLTNFPNEKFFIVIYNSKGHEVNRFNDLDSYTFKISVNEIGSNGMYFYIVKTNKEKYFAGKFLIQR